MLFTNSRHTLVTAMYVACLLTDYLVVKKKTATYVADNCKNAINLIYVAVCLFKFY